MVVVVVVVDLKLVTDFVPNHSSNMCEWFRKSVAREGEYEDYYVWRDAKNQAEVSRNSSVTPIVPNNWVNTFSFYYFDKKGTRAIIFRHTRRFYRHFP